MDRPQAGALQLFGVSRTIRFTLNGERRELSRLTVEARLADVPPEPVRKHGVLVNGVWYPVMQAFEAATGVPRANFISHAARRHLASLGFEMRGEVSSPTERAIARGTARQQRAGARSPADEHWHSEAQVQASVVRALMSRGWRILSIATTATREHGIDIIASRNGQKAGVEVKGYPSRRYANPARANETKRTSPSTQAVHWYSQAVLAAMRLRGRAPTWLSVIALPDFPRYRALYAETSGSLAAAKLTVWWVTPEGEVVEA